MIISDKNERSIELVSYSEKKNDEALKEKYLGWLNNPDITKSLASPALLSTDKGPEFIEESFDRFMQEDCIGFFIRYVPDNIFIGTAKLDNISNYTLSAWDGIMIGDKDYQGKGLASEVYRILLAYAFSELNLERIATGCNSENIAMIKTFERIGYVAEGRFRNADFIDNKFSDHLYFGILKEEFFKKNSVNFLINRE